MSAAETREAAALESGAARLGVALPEGALAKLEAYLALLAKWNRTYNLTAIREPERMVTHHALDSLAVVPRLPQRKGIAVLDVGSGGGLPGIPIAIARPDARVVLVDSASKKAAFLAQAAIELPLANVEAVAARVEDYAPGRRFAVVISRAFSDLATFARLASPHLAAGGVMLAMKGVHPDEELAELPASVEVVAAHRLDVPGLEGPCHMIVMRLREPSA